MATLIFIPTFGCQNQQSYINEYAIEKEIGGIDR